MTTEEAKTFLFVIKEQYYSPGGQAFIPFIQQAQQVLSSEYDAAEQQARALVARYEAGDETVYDKMQEAISNREKLYDLFLI